MRLEESSSRIAHGTIQKDRKHLAHTRMSDSEENSKVLLVHVLHRRYISTLAAVGSAAHTSAISDEDPCLLAL
jgi:hypothetical protein